MHMNSDSRPRALTIADALDAAKEFGFADALSPVYAVAGLGRFGGRPVSQAGS